MKKYKVVIEETVSDEFEVVADSIEKAKEIAVEKYNNCEFVLSPGEVQFKVMSIVNDDGELTDFFEF